MKAEAVRKQVLDLLKKRPFAPFIITLDSGERIFVEHPENIAYDPTPEFSAERTRFAAITRRLITHGTFDSISSITVPDERVESET